MSSSIVADLHSHTTASDGALTIEEIPTAATEAGVSWVATTDHDCIHSGVDSPITTIEGVTIIRGIELRVQTDTQQIDLLGYRVESTEELTNEIARLQENRVNRARKIITRVEAEIELSLDIDPSSGIGRPHIATAIAESDAPYDYTTAFEELIGDDCDCYFARDVTAVDQGIRLLKDACPVVGLAHPLRYDDPESALAVTDKLDAVERYYPYGTEVNTSIVDRAIERNNLLVTGGSDAHNKRLGQAGLSESQFEEFKTELYS
ncbi:PHP domain-containing protein [Halonotius pteroides]|uniref:PHP domain-containing protein n=1 Tax=Halonotius pteroides TaxID=268735 RepID=A0A3A6Q7I8_9EURY|nr:PHP domain-containing protein [Halonotius pteroides]RJX48503.1 PHP domain-containing protein [Halonotius pteroides]